MYDKDYFTNPEKQVYSCKDSKLRVNAMPNPNTIIKTIKKIVPEEIVGKFDFFESESSYIKQRIAIVNQMDKLLSKEQCLAVMEQQGCCTTGKPAVVHREFGKKYKDKNLKEKLELYDKMDTPHKPPCRLNDDGTLSVFWCHGQEGDYTCVCGNIKKLHKPVNIPITYCGCCGGHVRQNLKKSLGINLKLKEIVSSPISSNGKKHCEFLFEISK